MSRIAGRVERGGHSVPETKIRERYRRLWALVAVAAPRVQAADFWDNSTLDGPELVAEVAAAQMLAPPKWPAWAPDALTTRWASLGGGVGRPI